jgi:hypothetical protein
VRPPTAPSGEPAETTDRACLKVRAARPCSGLTPTIGCLSPMGSVLRMSLFHCAREKHARTGLSSSVDLWGRPSRQGPYCTLRMLSTELAAPPTSPLVNTGPRSPKDCLRYHRQMPSEWGGAPLRAGATGDPFGRLLGRIGRPRGRPQARRGPRQGRRPLYTFPRLGVDGRDNGVAY